MRSDGSPAAGGDGRLSGVDLLLEERIARNDARFREANEDIEAVAAAVGVDARVPFICECADTTCREIVPMTLTEYEEVRANARWFLNVPGHEHASLGVGDVVDERETYVIVEKTGHAGTVVEQLDQRAPYGPDDDAEQA